VIEVPYFVAQNISIAYMFELAFSVWSMWEDRNLFLDRLEYPGIYAIAVSDQSLHGKPFDMIKEIRYFGMTNSVAGLKGRLNQFNNSLRDKKGGGHGGAQRFRYDHRDGDALARVLFVSVMPFECNVLSTAPNDLLVMGEVANAEFVAFAKYVEKYGQLPQYNNKKLAPKLMVKQNVARNG
jgi:hypothetical protein